MDRRIALQRVLEDLMLGLHPTTLPDNASGNKFHVYFQPDQNTKLSYPAIVYQRDRVNNRMANNKSYSRTKGYQITVIDRNPDSKIPDAVSNLPYTSYLTTNRADGLHHDVFVTYF